MNFLKQNNMNLVKIEDLLVGDEILYASGSRLIRAKVIGPIAIKDMSNRWNNLGTTYYKTIKCKVETEQVVTTYQSSGGRLYNVKRKVNKHTGNYNETKYVDLNEKNIFLLNRRIYD
jgi:hypothetical protein